MPLYTGDGGDNTLSGSLGADTLVGLAGNDTYIVNDIGDIVVETDGTLGGIDLIETSVLDAEGVYTLGALADVENLRYTGGLAAQLAGNAAANLIEGNLALARNDSLFGGFGDDTLNAGAGRDLLSGGVGDDLLDGGTGNDTMIGGSGDDTFLIDALGDRVLELGGGGRDTILSDVFFDLRAGWTSAVENLAYTGGAARSLYGNGLGNLIVSQGGNADSLYGGDGNDTLDGGGGADVLTGGNGDDTYLAAPTDQIVEFLGGGTDRIIGTVTDISIGSLAEVMEGLVYTAGANNVLFGNNLANDMAGGTGRNTISGVDGDDRIFGGAGADILYGGIGTDVLAGGMLSGTDFNAAPLADTSRDELRGGIGDDRYLITDNRDLVIELAGEGDLDVLVSYVDASLRVVANVEALVLAPGSAAWLARGSSIGDVLVGNEGGNFIDGKGGNDTLSGWAGAHGAGEDVLDGGIGNDVMLAYDFAPVTPGGSAAMLGGDGDDLYIVGSSAAFGIQDSGGSDTVYVAANATLSGSDGVERIVLAGGDATLDAQAAAAAGLVLAAATGGAFAGFGAVTSVTGTEEANVIDGNGLANLIDGGGGADVIHGRIGADNLSGGDGTDVLFGDEDNDLLYGGLDNDALTGGTGNDAMYGGFGNDTLAADAGTQSGLYYLRTGDVLYGDDPFAGGAAGADQFRFAQVNAGNLAVQTSAGSGSFYFNCGAFVNDFAQGTDTMRFAASMVGDNDTLLENVQVVTGPGGFLRASEMVIFTTDAGVVFTDVMTAGAITSVIGSATSNFTVGAERIFVIDNGTDSAIFAFVAANADAAVTVDELYFIGTVSGVTTLAATDFSLF